MGQDARSNDGGSEHLRGRAIERLHRQRDFFLHLVIYVVVNALLIVIWAGGSGGTFWPIYVILGWGIAVAVQAYNVFFRTDPDDEAIKREIDRLR
ncbi:MAG TPA: 2TM domain-containing protein [Actinomycetota bacterium]|nr:2TM domain-containing protein [Actinomycetota bacterium]